MTTSNSTGNNHNILIGIPCFAGQINWRCTQTLIRIEKLLTEQGIPHHFDFLAGCSLIPQARNIFANVALFNANPVNQKPFTSLLMIDADGSFPANAVIEMLKADRPIVVLPFSRKDICWSNIVRAVKAGIPEERLSEFNGHAMITSLDQKISLKEPTPVSVSGAGCILIQRAVLEGLMEKHPEWSYRPDAEKRLRNIQSPLVFNFFQACVNKAGEYVGEDFFFVAAAREAGFQTYMLPWIETTHSGVYDFHSNVSAYAKLKERT